MKPLNRWRRYGFGWITIGLFTFSLVGHWLFGWLAYVDDQRTHGRPPQVAGWVVEMARDTFENWQSEFLQLLWQVAGLTYFLYVGSPQSKEEDDRLEAKLDAVLRQVDPERGDRLIRVATPHKLLDPKAGPLIAVKLHVLTRKTLGGLETDLQGRCLTSAGEPFPGLYAAGEVNGFGGGGMMGYNALEGTFLGGCLFSGRTAGRAAAAAV